MHLGKSTPSAWSTLCLALLAMLTTGLLNAQAQSGNSAWRKDAGVVAQSHVQGMINSGAGRQASLVGYQRGLGVPLIAIFNYEGYTTGGFLKRTMMSLAMKPDQYNNWHVVNVDEAGVFQGLPLRRNWRQVGQDGARANEVRRRGY